MQLKHQEKKYANVAFASALRLHFSLLRPCKWPFKFWYSKLREKNHFHVEGLKKISSKNLLLYLFYLFIHSKIMNVILIVQIINIRDQKRLIW